MIVLFDGHCNLCNRAVDFIIRRDPRCRLRLAAQQSAAGQRLLAQAGLADWDGTGLVTLDEGRPYTHSTAALQVARRLRAPWPLLYYGLIMIPRPIRDGIYAGIARRRYRLFGRRETCRVPDEAEQAHFMT